MTSITEIATTYMNIWNAGGDEVLHLWAAPDILVDYSHFPQPIKGVEAYCKMLQQTYHYFPDIKIKVHRVVPGGQTATVHWEYTGTHQNGNVFGAEAFGQQVKVSGLSLLDFEGDSVVRETGVVDNLSLIMQLGIFEGK